MNLSTSEAAREYLQHGLTLVKVRNGGKNPIKKDWNVRENCISDPDSSEQFEDYNIGLAHAYSGTCVIDIDDIDESRLCLHNYGIDIDELLNTVDAVKINSGREGRAKLLYRLPTDIKPLVTVRPIEKLEFRCADSGGKTVHDVLPPSIHPVTKNEYTWDNNCDMGLYDWSRLPELPLALLTLWQSLNGTATFNHTKNSNAFEFETKPHVDVSSEDIRAALKTLDSNTYTTWINYGQALYHQYNGEDEGLNIWDEWSSLSSKYPGYDEIEKKWRKFKSSGKKTITVLSILYDAKREKLLSIIVPAIENTKADPGLLFERKALTALCELKKSYVPDYQRIRGRICSETAISITQLEKAINSRPINVDTKTDHLSIARRIISTIGNNNILGDCHGVWLWHESGVWKKHDDRSLKKTTQNVLDQEYSSQVTITRSSVDSITDILKNDIFSTEEKWSTHPDIINLKNGELHFNQGKYKLQTHDREHYITTQIPIEYDPSAEAPRFKQFLQEIFEGDKDSLDKEQLVLEAMGYSLIASCEFEAFFILVGNGANGKSVLLEILKHLISHEQTSAVQPSEFGNKFQRAYLHQKLVNIVTEIPEGAIINDAALKAITSGELTTAEHKHQAPFSFKPFATCWFGTNHMPHTRDFSDALFRRAQVIEFNNIFKPEDEINNNNQQNNRIKLRDTKLSSMLHTELPGIFNLAIEGLIRLNKNKGFTSCVSIEEAKQKWRTEADQATQFVNDCCQWNPDAEISSAQIYHHYKNWAEEEGIRGILKRRSLTNRLIRLGATTGRSNSDRKIKGIEVIEDDFL